MQMIRDTEACDSLRLRSLDQIRNFQRRFIAGIVGVEVEVGDDGHGDILWMSFYVYGDAAKLIFAAIYR